MLRFTLLVLVEDVPVPLTVQVVSPGIVPEPLIVKLTLTWVAVVFVPLLGEVTATTGVRPWLTVIECCPDPKALLHATVTVFAPPLSATELVVAELDAAPATVQVVPPGIVGLPLTV